MFYEVPRKKLYCYDEVEFFLQTDEKKIFLCWDQIAGAVFGFYSKLKKVIENKLFLHSSITKDLGYMWQHYLALDSCVPDEQSTYQPDDALKFIEIKKEQTNFWIGEKHQVLSPIYKHTKTGILWLYNDLQGNIFIEVSPHYKWHFIDPEPGDGFIPFSEFMKDYKPILKTIISKEQAQQWLKQTEDFLNIVEKNNPFT